MFKNNSKRKQKIKPKSLKLDSKKILTNNSHLSILLEKAKELELAANLANLETSEV